MTPKEKAIELYEKFYYQLPSSLMDKVQDCTAQECALIAVNEILQVDCCDMSESRFNYHIEYWIAVEQEIKNL
jgi:hypothetical protein